MVQAVAPRRRYAAKIESCSELVTGGGGTNFDPHFRYLVSPNALTLFSSLPSISLLGTTIGGRYCHCYMHGRGDCRSPLYSTHSHTIIPLPSSLSKSIQTERSRLFSRGIFHYDQTFTRVIIMDLPSLPFSPFFARFRYQHVVVTRNPICSSAGHSMSSMSLLPTQLPTPYSPSLPPPSHSILPPADQPTVTVSRD